MGDNYFLEIQLMVQQAIKELQLFERRQGETPKNLKHISTACMKGNELDPEIVKYLGPNQKGSFKDAVDKVGSYFNFTQAPNGNGSLYNALVEIERVAKFIEQKKQEEADLKPATPSRTDIYIDPGQIEELRKLTPPNFDLCRLIRLLEELNTVYAAQCYMATIMVVRSILDHVPPLFNFRTFEEVASNYPGRSFKPIAQHLQEVSRKIADMQLHSPIQKKETIPTEQAVDCKQQMSVLIDEIVKRLHKP
jgi:hypothetical protein